MQYRFCPVERVAVAAASDTGKLICKPNMQNRAPGIHFLASLF